MTRLDVLLICAGAIAALALVGCVVVRLVVALADAVERARRKIYFKK